jgi:Na+-driven multidrug efflux pump
VLMVLILLFDVPVLGLFLGSASSPAVPLAQHIQYVCTWSFLLSGVMMVLFATMRSYGAVVSPLIIMFIAMYPGRLGFYELAYPAIGSEAVWWAFPVGSVLSAALTIVFYRYGSWRKSQLEAMHPVPAS